MAGKLRLADISIGRAVALVTTFPVMAMLVFGGQLGWGEWRYHQQIGQLSDLVELAVSMSDLVHEQQRERGATWVYLDSGGAQFGDILREQRQQTNRKLARFKHSAQSSGAERYDNTYLLRLQHVLDTLTELEAVRRDVDDFAIGVAGATDYYTRLNQLSIDLTFHLATQSPDPRFAIVIVGFTNFLQSKELTGIERAVAASGLVAGGISAKDLDRLKELIAAQEAHRKEFLSFATTEQANLLDQIVAGDAATEVRRLREIIFGHGDSDQLRELTAKHWFDTISDKIDGLKLVEDRIVADLLRELEASREAELASLARKSSLLIASICVTIGLSWWIGRRVVSERLRAEAALAASAERLAATNEELTQANREQAEFTYALSHDLKSPLVSVAMLHDAVWEESGARMAPDAGQMFAKARQILARMGKQIDDVLDYSRTISETFELVDVNLDLVLENVVADLEGVIRQAGAAVELGRLPIVSGNASLLSMLFVNLLSNALKFRDKDRTLEVSIEQVSTRNPDTVCIAVRDTGIGISEKHHQQIFGLFKRLYLEKDYPGTGIGLAICKRIANKHGGSIYVESELGVGTTFHVNLRKCTS